MARICDNCRADCGDDDAFCESCGYDFVAGTMPASAEGAGANPTGAGAKVPSVLDTGPIPAVDAGPRVMLEITVDRGFFDHVVTDGEVVFPDPTPPARTLELYGRELHVGRTSERRGVHPAIDVEALTGDPAVSTRHAIIRVADDGSLSVTDVGSTNGTFVNGFNDDAVLQGVPNEIDLGAPVFLGAWTCLRMTQVGSD